MTKVLTFTPILLLLTSCDHLDEPFTKGDFALILFFIGLALYNVSKG